MGGRGDLIRARLRTRQTPGGSKGKFRAQQDVRKVMTFLLLGWIQKSFTDDLPPKQAQRAAVGWKHASEGWRGGVARLVAGRPVRFWHAAEFVQCLLLQ